MIRFVILPLTQRIDFFAELFVPLVVVDFFVDVDVEDSADFEGTETVGFDCEIATSIVGLENVKFFAEI